VGAWTSHCRRLRWWPRCDSFPMPSGSASARVPRPIVRSGGTGHWRRRLRRQSTTRWTLSEYQDPLKATRESLGRARTISDVLDQRAYHRLDLYQQVCRPRGVEYSLDFCLRPAGMPLLGWGLEASHRDFSDRDRDVLELLGRQLAALIAAARHRSATPRGSVLTARETAVLTLVAEGRSNRAIAALLDISPFTVRTHLEHAFTRLGVQTRAAAVAAAFT
jgi:DNA-binding CsgD family transcriptional regulator